MPSALAAAKAKEGALVDDIMKRSVLGGDGAIFHTHNGFVASVEDKKKARQREKAEKVNTLTQWYGMKRAKPSKSEKQELELLRYANLVDPQTRHLAPPKASGPVPEFYEVGYYAGTGKKRRRRHRSFATQFMEENPQLLELAKRAAVRETRRRRKVHGQRAKKMDLEKKKKDQRRAGRRGGNSESGGKKVKNAKKSSGRSGKGRKAGES